jgi:hypothetical protein
LCDASAVAGKMEVAGRDVGRRCWAGGEYGGQWIRCHRNPGGVLPRIAVLDIRRQGEGQSAKVTRHWRCRMYVPGLLS